MYTSNFNNDNIYNIKYSFLINRYRVIGKATLVQRNIDLLLEAILDCCLQNKPLLELKKFLIRLKDETVEKNVFKFLHDQVTDILIVIESKKIKTIEDALYHFNLKQRLPINEFIVLPSFLKSLKDTKSFYIENFLNETNFYEEENAINLDYLRTYYSICKTNNKIEFFSFLVNELVMRGCQFRSQKPNNLLPKFVVESSSEIICANEKSNHQAIEFEKYDLSKFLSTYRVYTSEFFDRFPLDGFRFLSNEVNKSGLSEAFKNAGFDIRYTKNEKNNHNNFLIEGEDLENFSKNFKLNEDNTKNLEDNNHIKTKIVREKIEEIFYQRQFLKFREFCNKIKLYYVDEITEEIIFDFHEEKGVGDEKIKSICEILDMDYLIILETVAMGVIDPNEENIDLVFNDRKYQKFREFCNQNSIEKLSDLKLSDLLAYENSHGIGKLKVAQVKEKLENHGFFLVDYLCETIHRISDVFSENKYNKFREFCEATKIVFINEIKKELIDKFSILPRVGDLKVEQVRNKFSEIEELINSTQVDFEYYISKEAINFYSNYDLENMEVWKVLQKNQVFPYTQKFSEFKDLYFGDLIELGFDTIDMLNIFNLFKSYQTVPKLLQSIPFEDREIFVFEKKYLNNLTYEEIGEYHLQRTRQRVELLIRTGKERVMKFLEAEKFIERLKEFFIVGNGSCTTSKMEDFLESRLFTCILKDLNFPGLFYHPKLDMFFWKEFPSEAFENEFKDLLGERFTLENKLDDLVNLFDDYGLTVSTLEALEKIILNFSYISYAEYYSLKRLNFIDISDIIFKDYIKSPLYYDDEGFNRVRALAIDLFNVSIDDKRSFEGRIRDNEEMLLVGSKTYLHHNNLSYSMNIVGICENYLKELSKPKRE